MAAATVDLDCAGSAIGRLSYFEASSQTEIGYFRRAGRSELVLFTRE
jgi:hypothetical protein